MSVPQGVMPTTESPPLGALAMHPMVHHGHLVPQDATANSTCLTYLCPEDGLLARLMLRIFESGLQSAAALARKAHPNIDPSSYYSLQRSEPIYGNMIYLQVSRSQWLLTTFVFYKFTPDPRDAQARNWRCAQILYELGDEGALCKLFDSYLEDEHISDETWEASIPHAHLNWQSEPVPHTMFNYLEHLHSKDHWATVVRYRCLMDAQSTRRPAPADVDDGAGGIEGPYYASSYTQAKGSGKLIMLVRFWETDAVFDHSAAHNHGTFTPDARRTLYLGRVHTSKHTPTSHDHEDEKLLWLKSYIDLETSGTHGNHRFAEYIVRITNGHAAYFRYVKLQLGVAATKPDARHVLECVDIKGSDPLYRQCQILGQIHAHYFENVTLKLPHMPSYRLHEYRKTDFFQPPRRVYRLTYSMQRESDQPFRWHPWQEFALRYIAYFLDKHKIHDLAQDLGSEHRNELVDKIIGTVDPEVHLRMQDSYRAHLVTWFRDYETSAGETRSRSITPAPASTQRASGPLPGSSTSHRSPSQTQARTSESDNARNKAAVLPPDRSVARDRQHQTSTRDRTRKTLDATPMRVVRPDEHHSRAAAQAAMSRAQDTIANAAAAQRPATASGSQRPSSSAAHVAANLSTGQQQRPDIAKLGGNVARALERAQATIPGTDLVTSMRQSRHSVPSLLFNPETVPSPSAMQSRIDFVEENLNRVRHFVNSTFPGHNFAHPSDPYAQGPYRYPALFPLTPWQIYHFEINFKTLFADGAELTTRRGVPLMRELNNDSARQGIIQWQDLERMVEERRHYMQSEPRDTQQLQVEEAVRQQLLLTRPQGGASTQQARNSDRRSKSASRSQAPEGQPQQTHVDTTQAHEAPFPDRFAEYHHPQHTQQFAAQQHAQQQYAQQPLLHPPAAYYGDPYPQQFAGGGPPGHPQYYPHPQHPQQLAEQQQHAQYVAEQQHAQHVAAEQHAQLQHAQHQQRLAVHHAQQVAVQRYTQQQQQAAEEMFAEQQRARQHAAEGYLAQQRHDTHMQGAPAPTPQSAGPIPAVQHHAIQTPIHTANTSLPMVASHRGYGAAPPGSSTYRLGSSSGPSQRGSR